MSEENRIIMHGPVRVKVEVLVTDGEGTDGVVTYDLPPFRFPTAEEIKSAIAEVEKAEPIQAASMRLMTKGEAFNFVIQERYGRAFEDDEEMTFATPGGDGWDIP